MATRALGAYAEVSREARARVMIVDDSAVARMIVQRIVDSTDRFEVVAQAPTAAAALAALARVNVDIILLDVEMPDTDGIAAIPALLEASGNAAILMLSAHTSADAELSLRAMTMGASDTLLKPGARHMAGDFADTLAGAMLRLVRPARGPRRGKADGHSQGLAHSGAVIDCLGIAASTGGPHALALFFDALPRDAAMPILLTQHLPDDFMPVFARQIAAMTGRPAAIARDGDRVIGGGLLVAPGDAHLALCRIGGIPRVRLDRRPAASGCLPSADPMFETMAEVFGPGAVGVVLSGMGRDGALGARAMVGAGAEMLAQDQASAMIWGMPGAIAREGLARRVGAPVALAEHVARRERLARWS